MRRLIILGAGGHGKVCAEIAQRMGLWNDILFMDDNFNNIDTFPYLIIDKINIPVYISKDTDFFVAIGNNRIRKDLIAEVLKHTSNLITLIDPNVIIGKNVEIGIGTVIMAGVIIHSSSKVGKGCIVNTSSSLDHDILMENFVHVSPGTLIAGNVTIGVGSWLGIGSVVSNNINICGECKIGAGTVVIRNISQPGTYVGVPAKRVNG